MMDRAVPFDRVTALMTAHLVSRQIYAGSGRVGLGEHSEQAGFQLSQRADYIHMRVGLQTTFDRPIINTRDESHSTARYRRLHVIVGDANRMDVPQLLKLGTTSMLLWLLEHAEEGGLDFEALMDGLALANPVGALHTVSRDLTCAARWRWNRGRRPTHGICRCGCAARCTRSPPRCTAPTAVGSHCGRTNRRRGSWRCGGRPWPMWPPCATPMMTPV